MGNCGRQTCPSNFPFSRTVRGDVSLRHHHPHVSPTNQFGQQVLSFRIMLSFFFFFSTFSSMTEIFVGTTVCDEDVRRRGLCALRYSCGIQHMREKFADLFLKLFSPPLDASNRQSTVHQPISDVKFPFLRCFVSDAPPQLHEPFRLHLPPFCLTIRRRLNIVAWPQTRSLPCSERTCR